MKLAFFAQKIQKCLNIAKLYASIKDFESAKKYLDTYLKTFKGSGDGLKFLGDVRRKLKYKLLIVILMIMVLVFSIGARYVSHHVTKKTEGEKA